MYHRSSPTQDVTLSTGFGLTEGSFSLKLSHHGVAASATVTVPFSGSAADMVAALETLDNVGRVEARVAAWTDLAADATHRRWSVTFLGEWSDPPPLLEPLWAGAGCAIGCVPFDTQAQGAGGAYVTVAAGAGNGQWEEQAQLQVCGSHHMYVLLTCCICAVTAYYFCTEQVRSADAALRAWMHSQYTWRTTYAIAHSLCS
jgi:hypothetical protein